MWFSVFWEVLIFFILAAISFVVGLCFWVGADPAGSAPTQKTFLRILPFPLYLWIDQPFPLPFKIQNTQPPSHHTQNKRTLYTGRPILLRDKSQQSTTSTS